MSDDLMIFTMDLYMIMLVATVGLIGVAWGGSSDSTDINWGKKTTNCESNEIWKSTNEKTYRAKNADEHIVYISAQRYDKTHEVWGKGPIRGTQIAKNLCYKDARVFYSTISGTTKAPQTIDMKFASKSKEICGWGYHVEICYKLPTKKG